jgi:flavin reductase (DIM6/NTAB) family NADH-FMN oxidoreductase RutF
LSSYLDLNLFRQACSLFATGVTVATTCDPEGRPHGLTASSFSSVSLEPPLVLVCIATRSAVHETFFSASYFGINILSECQRNLSSQFARSGEDRFEGVNWTPGPLGSPWIDGALAQFECRTFERRPAGDHTIFLGEVEATRTSVGAPLLYFSRAYRSLKL